MKARECRATLGKALLRTITLSLIIAFSASVRGASIEGSFQLAPGLNMFGIPVDAASTPDLGALLSELGPSRATLIQRFDTLTNSFEKCEFDSGGQPTGAGCSASVALGDAWLVTAPAASTVAYSVQGDCPGLTFNTGLNLVSVTCSLQDLTAHDLLAALGDASVVRTLESLDPQTSRWLGATYNGNTVVGPNFPILLDRGYLVWMRQSADHNPPSADAGLDRDAVATVATTLQATGSSDPDGDALTFAWTLKSSPPGSTPSLVDAEQATPAFTPDLPGTYTLELAAQDAIFSVGDEVVVTAIDPASGPDADQDGLSDAAEAILGTNPNFADSDLDGLTDGDEVLIYGTDPTLLDTDGDGFSDGDEVSAGSDPNDSENRPTDVARPSNTTCIAPERPTNGTTVQLVNAYPSLPLLNFAVKALQAPGDPSRWFVLEKSGRLRVFDNNPAVSAIQTYLDLALDPDFSIYTGSEGGLLGAAFHPDWPAVKELYLSYTISSSGIKSQITRFIINDDSTLPASYTKQVLLTVNQEQGNHNGGDIAFGWDRLLYIGLGDGGGSGDPNDRSQDTTRLLGGMLRIDVLGVDFVTDVYLPRGDRFAGNKCGAGANTENCPEIWAWGFRNPWRWSFDFPSQKLWLGDVGQGTWEEVDIVKSGGNYGWRCREGANNFNLSGCPASGLTDPVHEYQHGSGNVSITGGFVYRGALLPDLVGEYVFADFNSGRIWTLEDDAAGGYLARELIDSSILISAFARGHDGELYAVRYANIGRLYRLEQAAPGGSDLIPLSLADTGCADPGDPTQPASGLVQYRPAAPFWSDGAVKSRYVGLPDGADITVQADDDWDLPAGSVVRKDFRVGGVLVETRLLMRHPDGVWAGYTYEWNAAQTAATRVRGGKVRDLGSRNWIYPSEGECMSCHTEAANFALSLETAQLNNEITYDATGITDNQLEVFNHIGMFAVDVPEPVSTLPQLADPADTGATLDARARAYLHTNCSQCHQTGGPTPVSMDLLYSTSLADANICNVVPEAGPVGNADLIVAPGDAGRSVLVQRMNLRDVNGMPPLGSDIPDADGVALISNWINSLAACP